MNDYEPVLSNIAGSIRAQKMCAILNNKYPNVRFHYLIVRWVNDQPYSNIYPETRYPGRRINKSALKEMTVYSEGVRDAFLWM